MKITIQVNNDLISLFLCLYQWFKAINTTQAGLLGLILTQDFLSLCTCYQSDSLKCDCLCFCLSAVYEKQTSAAGSTLEALVEEEGCTLEKQMFKGAIAAALCRVTQLCGHGFANINAI